MITHYTVSDYGRYVLINEELDLSDFGPERRRKVIGEYMARGKRVIMCKHGPYDTIGLFYKAIKRNRFP